MTIFTHVVVGTNDIEASRRFFDPVLGALGLKRLLDMEGASSWGADTPQLLVTRPLDGRPATAANGGVAGLAAPSREAVDAFHAAAIANGGNCDGPPGPRGFAPDAYGAYIRDPIGNKFCAFSFVPP